MVISDFTDIVLETGLLLKVYPKPMTKITFIKKRRVLQRKLSTLKHET
jgi:hypothetical protein